MNGSKLLSSVVLLYIDDRLQSEFSSPSPFSCLVWKSQIAHRVSYSRQLCGQLLRPRSIVTLPALLASLDQHVLCNFYP